MTTKTIWTISVAFLVARGGSAQEITIINCPPTIIGDNQSISSNTQLNVFPDGTVGASFIAGNIFSRNENLEVNIYGGSIGDSFEARDGSVINILGGRLGWYSNARSGSRVFVSGGVVEPFFDAFGGSYVNISSGLVKGSFDALSGSHVIVSGGWVDSMFVKGGVVEVLKDGHVGGMVIEDRGYVTMTGGTVAQINNRTGGYLTVVDGVIDLNLIVEGGTVRVSGGRIETFGGTGTAVYDASKLLINGGMFASGLHVQSGGQLFVSGGAIRNGLSALPGSTISLFGSRFAINGDIQNTPYGQAIRIDERNVELTGELEDAILFTFDLNSSPSGPGEDYFAPDAMLTFTILSHLSGDANSDATVEQGDLDLVLLNWGDDLFNPYDAGWINDVPTGSIDQEELDRVLLNWGETQAVNAAAVPEPSTFLLLLALVSLLRSRVRWMK